MLSVKLLEPVQIGTRIAPSRVLFGQHETNLGDGRSFSDRHVAYYARRAAGGAGIIVTEEASVHESDWPYERAPLASSCAQGWGAISAACHSEGALVIAALGHAGGQGTSHWSQRELWSPSRVPEVNTREVPKWMEESDIQAVIDGFVSAARSAVVAGCDGVEINAGQYSLVRQFLSGLTNHRGDEWGADRTLFARTILERVRGVIGEDRILALRLSCDELAPWAGITPEQAPEVIAGILSPADGPSAKVDMLTVVRGSIYSVSATRPDGHTPTGFNLSLVSQISDSVRALGEDAPLVVAQGSIVDVDMAESALTDHGCDLVEMTRAQIADADLVAKVRRGDVDRVRPATLGNQRTQVRDNRNPIVTSTSDPRSGHETEDPDPDESALVLGRVLVVGGGPAGLEAARVAARRGHSVELVESSDRFGGAVRVAQAMPGFSRLGLLVDWLVSECRALGVDMRASESVDAAMIGAWLDQPEDLPGGRHVVIATGGEPGRLGFETTRAAVVSHVADVFEDPSVLPSGEVLIWDPIGGPWGVACAEMLTGAGRSVHLATQDNIVGNELARSGDLAPANARLQQLGVNLHRRRKLRSVKKNAAVLENRFTGELETIRVAAV
ncbi:MAG: mycofactocin system FadH/OYE family oxidoreductase 1, partial [Microthrixaceae bacterium]|nr:mycofactocin system FadH/OYE family oxidoreductase 1 [Microthrixaceae bacterium]